MTQETNPVTVNQELVTESVFELLCHVIPVAGSAHLRRLVMDSSAQTQRKEVRNITCALQLGFARM